MTDFTYLCALPILLDQQGGAEILINQGNATLDIVASQCFGATANMTGLSTASISVANQTTGAKGNITASSLILSGTPAVNPLPLQLPLADGSATIYVSKSFLFVYNSTSSVVSVKAHPSGTTINVPIGGGLTIACDGHNVYNAGGSAFPYVLTSVTNGDGLIYNSGTGAFENTNTVLTTTNTKTVSNKTYNNAVLTGGAQFKLSSNLWLKDSSRIVFDSVGDGSGTITGGIFSTGSALNFFGGANAVNQHTINASGVFTHLVLTRFEANASNFGRFQITNDSMAGYEPQTSGGLMEVTGANTTDNSLYQYTYGTQQNNIVWNKAGGSLASRTALVSGEIIGALKARGWDTSAYAEGGRMQFEAAETFTTSARGTAVKIYASNTGTTTPALQMTISQGNCVVSKINGNTITTGTGVLTLGTGKTLTASNTLTLTATDGSTAAFGAGGTVAYTGGNLSQFAATTSAQLASVISDETGSGSLVFGTSPSLSSPIVSSGSLDLSASGAGQVIFPSTQNPSGGANTLDDYSEGSYTPAGTGVTLTSVSGTYIKIGRLVTVCLDVTWPTNSDTGNARISLPITGSSPSSGTSGYTDSGFILSYYTAATYLELYNGAAATTNALLSGKRVVLTLSYFSAS